MSLSMHGDEVLARPSDTTPAAARFVAAAPYTPDLDAYLPDPANEKRDRFREAYKKRLAEKKPVEFDLSVTCVDGRLERFSLTEADTEAYLALDDDVLGREAFINARITERRLTSALTGWRKMQRGGPFVEAITEVEEANLREFDAIVTRASLRESDRPFVLHESVERENGEQSMPYEVLRRDFGPMAERALGALRTGNAHQLREDGFWDGSFEAGDGYYRPWSDREYLARGGPAYRQQLVSDVWDAQAKNFYAWTHDPVIREGCAILTEFPLGRGVRAVAKDAKLQNFIDNLWIAEKIDHYLRIWVTTLSRDGELFLRKIRHGDGTMSFTTADAQTIWEIITDAENVGHVYYYLQRYPTRYQMDSAGVEGAAVRYVDRIIPACDMIHIRINADAHDVRGRSDIFPALGWAKRLRDYADAEVGKSQAHAAYAWTFTVKGGAADLQRIAAQIPNGRPQSGSSWVFNEGVTVEPVSTGSSSGTSGNGSTYELLLNQIALAFGVPKDYFGVSSRGSRATALVAADPASKRFEDRQNIIKGELVEPIIADAIQEARAYSLLDDVDDFSWRASFPAIIKADAPTRAGLLQGACANGTLSHKTMSEEMVGELDLEDYDYDAEQAQIKAEIGVEGWQIASAPNRPVKRGMPAKDDVAFDPGEVPNPAAGEVGGPVQDGTDMHSAAAKPTAPAAKDAAGNASPSSAIGAAKVRNEVGAHESRAAILSRITVQEAARIVSEAGGVAILR